MKICVLCGGRSNERDVSLSTGAMVAKALRNNGHSVVLVDVCRGIELNGISPEESFTAELPILNYAISDESPDVREFFERKEGFFGKNVLEICREADVVFNALHGDEGENGKLQATFDLLGIKYTGSGMEGCLLAMNKCLSKRLFVSCGIPTPPAVFLKKGEYSIDECKVFGFPCVVKPGSLGSSVGVSIVHCDEELEAALKFAEEYEDLIIIEKYVNGREFSVGVVGGIAVPPIEIIPKQGFYDYKNKYQSGCTEEICPADIPNDVAETLKKMAVDVYKVLGLGAYGRVDFMMDDAGCYCLEANTLPGMTGTSLLPQEARAAGIEFPQLLEKIIEESLKLKR